MELWRWYITERFSSIGAHLRGSIPADECITTFPQSVSHISFKVPRSFHMNKMPESSSIDGGSPLTRSCIKVSSDISLCDGKLAVLTSRYEYAEIRSSQRAKQSFLRVTISRNCADWGLNLRIDFRVKPDSQNHFVELSPSLESDLLPSHSLLRLLIPLVGNM